MKGLKISVFLLLFIFLGTQCCMAANFIIAGDLDLNNTITASEAREILRMSTNLSSRYTYMRNSADLDFDMKVTAADARLALRYSVSLEKPYKILQQAYTVRDYVIRNKYYQASNSSYGDKCWGFSGIYAKAINTGNTQIIRNNINRGNNPQGLSMSRYTSRNKSDILKEIGNELRYNKSCVVQVNGKYPERHYVAVVGYKTSANLNNLKETDLLIIDVYDGMIKPMSNSTRYLFSNYSRYNYYYEMYKVY